MQGRMIKPGATNQSTVLRVLDADNAMQPVTDLSHLSPPLQITCQRIGGGDWDSAVYEGNSTLVNLAAINSAHVDGGFRGIGLGCYRFDIPDSMVVADADELLIFAAVAGSNYVIEPVVHPLGVNGMPRVNTPAGDAFTLQLSRRSDGTLRATKEVNIGASEDDIAIALDFTPVMGSIFVLTVGTPTITASGQLTCEALGPRDSQAMVKLKGGQQAGATYTVSVPVTMRTGEQLTAIFIVRVRSQ